MVFDNEDSMKRSIEFFNELPDRDKVTIVADPNPATFKPRHYYNYLAPLLSGVQLAISKFDDNIIGNRLVDLGLEDTYARLFVSPMKPPGARKASGCPMSYDRGPVRGDPLNHFSQSPLGVRQPAGVAAPMRPGR